jgi:hypothetical protein
MISERALMESELADVLEGEFALPVILKGPDGVTYATSRNNPLLPLVGHVLYDARREEISDVGPVIIRELVVTLRRTSCPARLLAPQAGDKWEIQIPQDPTLGAPMVSYALDGSKAPEDGRTIGTIRLYPKRARQSP